MLPLFLFILAVSYITWLLMDMMRCGWITTCNGDLRVTGCMVLRLQSVVEMTHSLMGFEPASHTSEALVDRHLNSSQSIHVLELDSAATDSLPRVVL
jgi:hypothetical protein